MRTLRGIDLAPLLPLGVIHRNAALPALDALFNWDYRDETYNRRRENTTIVSIACNACDECCFCTSVGGGPHNTTGSDIMLSKSADGGYLVEILTPKGEALAAELGEVLGETPGEVLLYAEVPVKFDANEWVSIAKGAGMKYIVITSKHHDGFAMFHSRVSPYNIYDATPFKRDPIAELKAACDAAAVYEDFTQVCLPQLSGLFP